MLSNIGLVSFLLYGIFILITLVAMIIAFRIIQKDIIAADKLDKIIDLFKYSVFSVAIATTTLIVSNLFKEREQDVKELEYFDKYADDVKKVDGIQERFQLSKYLSIVAPSGELKNSWREYFDSTKLEYQEYLKLKAEKQVLDSIKNPTSRQIIQKQQISETIKQKESPLVSYKKSDRKDFMTAQILESKGYNFLFNKKIVDANNAFVESENFANQYHQVYEISQYLKKNIVTLTSHPDYWKTIYLKMATDFSVDMSPDIKNRFLDLSR